MNFRNYVKMVKWNYVGGAVGSIVSCYMVQKQMLMNRKSYSEKDDDLKMILYGFGSIMIPLFGVMLGEICEQSFPASLMYMPPILTWCVYN